MTTALAMVPSPGRSRSGIHNAKTTRLKANAAIPIDKDVRELTPSASTVQGPLPNSATTRSASPVPNNHSPKIRTNNVDGRALQRDCERHGVTGIERDGRSACGM